MKDIKDMTEQEIFDEIETLEKKVDIHMDCKTTWDKLECPRDKARYKALTNEVF